MLSAAHILAMDAKNLFDVVDSIRNRYQHIQCKIQSSGTPASTSFADVSSVNVDIYNNENLKTQHSQISSSDEGNMPHRTIHTSHETMEKSNEPLKIIEETFNTSEEHMYCNTSTLNGQP